MVLDKIHVQICIDGLDEMLNEIMQLQTYKLGEGNEKTLVGCDDVINIFRKHLRTKVGTSSDPQWIPVSERFPELDEDVLVTDFGGGWATVHDDSCGAYEDTGERFWYTSQNVIAWMPLPEPYMEDEEA